MSVGVEALFTSALGLQPPWVVQDVKLDTAQRRIDFQIACQGARLACPACGASAEPVHDRLARSWRHLDFFQFEAWLHCDVPRVACGACGKTTQVAVPWARPGSGFTAAFEALALTLCRDLPVRSLRRRILRAFVGRGLLEGFEAKEMLGYKHSGFSVDTSVCIAAQDRSGLERLLRYCARPPFALDRLRKAGGELVYRCAKQRSEPGSDRRDQRNANRGAKHGAQADELHLTPLELIARIAALVPPPRTHRHRYFGVLAPNSPLRPAVTALAQDAVVQPAQVQAEPASTGAVAGAAAPEAGNPLLTQAEPTQPVQPKRPAHYLWAVLIARIYEVFPLVCPICGGQMRIIAFITYSADIRQILEHIGVETEPPRITPARGPPLWDGCDAQAVEVVEPAPDWDEAAQPAPDFEVDQSVSW